MAEVHSIAQEASAVRNAMETHDWPIEVEGKNDVTVSMFRKAQAQRAHDDWTPIDLLELARICGLVEMAEKLKKDLDEEGLRTPKGAPNPALAMLLSLQTAINASYRRLGMTSMSVGQKRSRANRGAQAREATEKLGKVPPKAKSKSVGNGDLLN